MRIGILTLPLHTNYGGILQAYALQTTLLRMGHKVEVITSPYLIKEPNIWIYFKRYVRKYIRKKHINIYDERNSNYTTRTIRQYTQKFIHKRIRQREYINLSSIKEKDFDCIVVGSDQVWRYDFRGCFQIIENAYLKFAEGWNIKRIAYAASFGLGEWAYSEESTQTCKQLIKQFDAISVREKDGVSLCKERLGIETIQVLDPTMLLTKYDYLKIARNKFRHNSNGNLFYYMLDSQFDINPILKSLGNNYVPFTVNSKCEDDKANLYDRIHPPVEEWLNAFEKADLVVTDSFHGCVFSIIFQKPFWVVRNDSGGNSRIYSLLEMFHLENRLVDDFPNKEFLSSEINWSEVQHILNIQKEKSIKFLNDNIYHA